MGSLSRVMYWQTNTAGRGSRRAQADADVDASRKFRQVLEPGDIINTGTPQGVALSGKFLYLREGDRMEISIEKLGRQEQKLVAFTKQ